MRFALVTSGVRVFAFGDKSEDLDNMKIALRGITLNLDHGIERYREISGMILEPDVREAAEQIKAMANKLFAILQRVDPRNPNERLRKVVKDFILFVHNRVKTIQGTLDRRSISITLQLCDRLEQGVEALVSTPKSSRQQLEYS
jgi:hypothetical protein